MQSSETTGSFVLAFLYAKLIALPLLDVNRRYYGWKMAAYIVAVLYTTMVLAALIMDVAFDSLGWITPHRSDLRSSMTQFSFDYTFWVNVVFGSVALALFVVARRQPATSACCGHAHREHDH